MGYAKVFDSILSSSLNDEPLHVRWLFVSMIASCNRYGQVFGTVDALRRRANLSREECEDALSRLTSPDVASSSPAEEGRRVIPIEQNLWQIVNYVHYREMRDPEEQREKTRQRVQRYRERQHGNTPVTPCNAPVTPGNDIAEAEAEAEADTKDIADGNAPVTPCNACNAVTPAQTKREREAEEERQFSEFWAVYPRKVAKPVALKAFRAAIATATLADLLAGVERWSRSRQWAKDDGQYIPHPATWLNQRRWEDRPDPGPPRAAGAGRDYSKIGREL